MDSAGDAVLQLQVHLGDGIVGENGGVRDITDGSGLNHVADGESLDRLVLRSATSAVGAAHGLDVAAAVLVATVVRPLLDHFDGFLWLSGLVVVRHCRLGSELNR